LLETRGVHGDNVVVLRFAPVGLYLALVLVLWPENWGHDAVSSISCARDMADGTYSPTGSPAAHRVLMIAPVAACYRVFGFNEWSGSIFIILCGVGLVAAGQAAATRLFDLRTGVLAGLLLATNPLVVLLSVPIMGDVPVACVCAVAFWWTVRYRQAGARLDVFAAGLVLGLGYWIKESAGFMAVFVALWLSARRDVRGLAAFGAAAALPVVVGAALLAAHTGEWFGPARILKEDTLRYFGHELGLYRWTVQYPMIVLVPTSFFFLELGPLMWAFLLGLRRNGKFLGAAVGVMSALVIWFPMSLDPPVPAFAANARYLMIALAPVATGAAAWLARLPPRTRPALCAMIVGSAILMEIGSADFKARHFDIVRETIRIVERASPRVAYADEHLVRHSRVLATPGSSVQWRAYADIRAGDDGMWVSVPLRNADARPHGTVVSARRVLYFRDEKRWLRACLLGPEEEDWHIIVILRPENEGVPE
jgi:hypothetical protein